MHGQSLERWWSNCILDDEKRNNVRSIVMSRGGFGEGLWGIDHFNLWYGYWTHIEADNEDHQDHDEETVVDQSSKHGGHQTQINQSEQRETEKKEEQPEHKGLQKTEETEDSQKQQEQTGKIDQKEEQQEVMMIQPQPIQHDPPIRSEGETTTVKDEMEQSDSPHSKEDGEVSQEARGKKIYSSQRRHLLNPFFRSGRMRRKAGK